jgi:hypothetical protein
MTTEPIENVTYTWTGRPGVVWIQKPSGWLVLSALTYAAAVGAILVLCFQTAIYENRPQELTAEERTARFLRQETFPAIMTIKIVDAETFKRNNPNALAVSFTTRSPCEIDIPAGWEIVFSPQLTGSNAAMWEDHRSGDIIAHEILHCLRGSWHR